MRARPLFVTLGFALACALAGLFAWAWLDRSPHVAHRGAALAPESAAEGAPAAPAAPPAASPAPLGVPLTAAAAPAPDHAQPTALPADLYLQAMQLVDAADQRSLLRGLQWTQVCRATVDRAKAGARASAPRQPAPDAESQAAFARLQQHCRGFAANEPAANAGLQSRFASKLRALPSRYVPGLSTGTASPWQVRTIVEEGDWASFDMLFADVLPHLLAARSLDPNGEAAQVWAAGLMLAPCDLGKDCSFGGIDYLAFCGLQRWCPGSLQQMLTNGLTPSQRADAERARAEIVAAFRRRDTVYFTGRH